MAKKRLKYTVRFEQDADGDWTAVIDRSQGVSCVTQGRSLSVARKRIREALGLYLDDDKAAAEAELVEDILVPARARGAVRKASEKRNAAKVAVEGAAVATAEAARKLVAEGLSYRDAAEILGVSFQRVHQLVEEPDRKAG